MLAMIAHRRNLMLLRLWKKIVWSVCTYGIEVDLLVSVIDMSMLVAGHPQLPLELRFSVESSDARRGPNVES